MFESPRARSLIPLFISVFRDFVFSTVGPKFQRFSASFVMPVAHMGMSAFGFPCPQVSFFGCRKNLGHPGAADRAHGGEDITPEAEILIDNVVEGMGVQKILGLYVRRYGVIDGKAATRGTLELSQISSRNWVGYANVVRQEHPGLPGARERPPAGPTRRY